MSTTPRGNPIPEPVTLPSMFAKYPEGHEKAGQMITRVKKCSKGHVTEQKGINPEWLKAKRDGARELLSKDYAVDDKGRSWLPRECALCRGRGR